MRAPAIATRRLGRSFGPLAVLVDVTLDVQPGEVFALIGSNGSGKTTLIEILATLLLPSSGSARIHGFDVVAMGARVRRTIGYCPSNLHSFYPRLTGRQNLQFFASLQGLPGRAGRARVEALLERVGLGDAAGQRVERYSDGMKGRLSVARALLADPAVVLLDEPTKSLDPEARARIRALLRERRADGEARTLLWVTHDLEEARGVADRIGRLRDGVVRAPAVAS
jgi:ABC-2 type transport system ATP-binding protein